MHIHQTEGALAQRAKASLARCHYQPLSSPLTRAHQRERERERTRAKRETFRFSALSFGALRFMEKRYANKVTRTEYQYMSILGTFWRL